MKKLVNNLLFLLFHIPALSFAQSFISSLPNTQDKFTIIGKISGLAEGTEVIISIGDGRPQSKAVVTNGVFKSSGTISEPIIASIALRPDWAIIDGEPVINFQKFYLEKGGTEIVGPNLVEAKVFGGPTQNEYVNSGLSLLTRQRDSAMLPIFSTVIKKDSIITAYWGPILEIRQKAYKDAALAFIKIHKNSYVTLDLLNYFLKGKRTDDDSLFASISPQLKNTIQGKKLAVLLMKKKELSVGKAAPNFIQPDVSGYPVALNSFKGKYVLVEFWASWCKPCRAESPNLIKAYNEFKGNNFEILSVSVDDNKRNWLKAIKDDKLTWTQVSDLKGLNNPLTKSWGITGVPKNYLLDPNGIIVATDLRGDNLFNKLRSTLK